MLCSTTGLAEASAGSFGSPWHQLLRPDIPAAIGRIARLLNIGALASFDVV